MASITQEILEAAGQLLLVGFRGVEAPPESIQNALKAGEIGGVILFSRNISQGNDSLRTLAALNEALDGCRPPCGTPVFVGVDQEGGRVQRVRKGATRIPPMLEVGKHSDPELAAQVGEVIASELSALGFNVNFAPVLDVLTNPENVVIGDRAFGGEVSVVAEMAGALTRGHHRAGVLPCGKHFPGHGDTFADSHYELPVVAHAPGTLEERELLPFAQAIQAGMPMLMTAHLLIPSLDEVHPITLSSQGIGRLLREKLEFDGVVITDDLEMKAVADRYEVEEMVELGLMAGVDIFLICHTEEKWRRAFAHLVKMAAESPEARRRVFESAKRVREMKARYLPEARYKVPEGLSSLVGTEAHRALMERVRADPV